MFIFFFFLKRGLFMTVNSRIVVSTKKIFYSLLTNFRHTAKGIRNGTKQRISELRCSIYCTTLLNLT